VNYELPNVPEDYVHRIGRTGRAGATGIAVSLVAHDEAGLLRDIEKVLRKQIPQLPLPHFARSQPQPERAPAAAARHSQPRQQNSPPRQQQSQPRQQHSQSKPQHAHAKKKSRRRWNPSRGQQQSGAARGRSGRG
jgi:ATP-dependent RNA helicase RhlE